MADVCVIFGRCPINRLSLNQLICYIRYGIINCFNDTFYSMKFGCEFPYLSCKQKNYVNSINTSIKLLNIVFHDNVYTKTVSQNYDKV